MNSSESFTRNDARSFNALRPIHLNWDRPKRPRFCVNCFGNTQVICACTIDNKVPNWMRAQGVEGGWMTAEYSMLPYSTLDRKQRDSSRGKVDGRTIEIQRLIGRSLRAVIDLKALGAKTMWIDCDVLQADGGTRTASITGAYIAAQIAIERLILEKQLEKNPFVDSVAAVSAGIYHGTALLDLDYLEDKDAEVDANIVMTGSGNYVEVQSSGEEATYSEAQLNELIRSKRRHCRTEPSTKGCD